MKKRYQQHVGKIRYAVVGLGHIAQNAILPAFEHAAKNSQLAALVSDDEEKLDVLSREYGVENCFHYDDYELCLRSGEIDAVYIALPNNLHADYCVRAAEAGIHVLCEKPLAATEEECQQIIKACADSDVKLMTAYRLHFERGNLEAIELVRSGKIGEPKIFNSVFTMQVAPGNIRTKRKYAGETLYDIGIYCINASRYIFGEEPVEVIGFSGTDGNGRFNQVEENTGALLRFADGKLAGFLTSFGATDTADFEIIGSEGRVRVIQAYDYMTPTIVEWKHGDHTRHHTYNLRDQFAPEIIYFSDCILRNREPEPSGIEGLIDVHIIRSLYESIERGRPVKLKPLGRRRRPDLRQEIHRPRVTNPKLIHVAAPTME
ncbi:MAG TPA: Gfo/Idh/MocA family oxidoreductase [Verrucomicrobiae bacterium]|nr:Gfo/Idh/MocA family oxidoreductase [Verrucomicrobiae bacterium]